MIKKVKRIRVFDQAVVQMRNAILDGIYPPGSRLPTEQELCDALDVSRSTVREALKVIEAEGLITVRRGSGAYVTKTLNGLATQGEILGWLSQRKESVIQILQVRESIEWLTSSLAASSHTNEFIEELQGMVDGQWNELKTNSSDPDMVILSKLDIEFHLAISKASGNNIAHEIISHIVPAFAEANRAVLWVGRNIEISIKEHQNIVNALAACDSKAAEDAMREHISRVREDICEYLGDLCEE